MDKDYGRPTRADIEKALQVVNAQTAVTRDHKATMEDSHMLETMAQSWPAWRQWLEQCQRDMARYPRDEQDGIHMNMMMLCFSQIMSRTMEAVEKGSELCQKK